MRRCKVTGESRQALRAKKVTANGRVMPVMEYIDNVAKIMPPVAVNGKPINPAKRMRDVYYQKGLKGLNLYIKYYKIRLSVEMSKKK
jgi:hypothetical protein